MTEEIINKDELKNLRFLLQNGQKLAISTKEFERVFDKIDSLEQENERLFGKVVELAGKDVLCKKYEKAFEEIRNYCDRIEQGSVISTQDCLINSIKNIAKEVLNA